jgi:CHASE2 domain-containing sensor protein
MKKQTSSKSIIYAALLTMYLACFISMYLGWPTFLVVEVLFLSIGLTAAVWYFKGKARCGNSMNGSAQQVAYIKK